MGASVRPGGLKLQTNQSGSPLQPLVTCSNKGRAKAEKNNIKQTDENKKITISALLGGNFAYHTPATAFEYHCFVRRWAWLKKITKC